MRPNRLLNVAQIFNLLYRRVALGRAFNFFDALGLSATPQSATLTPLGFQTRLLNRRQLRGRKQSDAKRSHSRRFAKVAARSNLAKPLECERFASLSCCPTVLQSARSPASQLNTPIETAANPGGIRFATCCIAELHSAERLISSMPSVCRPPLRVQLCDTAD